MEEKKIYEDHGISIYLEEYDLNESRVILKIANDSDYAIGITSNMTRVYIRKTPVEKKSEVYTTCLIFPELFCAQNNIPNDLKTISGKIQFLNGNDTTYDFEIKLEES